MLTKYYQVTILCTTKVYRPISCIIKIEQEQDIDLTKGIDTRRKVLALGIKKICATRCWTNKDLKKYAYTLAKAREYNK